MQGKTCISFRALMWITFMFSPLLLSSQINSANNTVDSTKVSQPQAIPVINIIQKIDETNKEIKSAGRKLQPSNAVKTIDSLFPVYAEFLQLQKSNAEAFAKANPNRQKINNLIVKWIGYEDYLKNWESVINDYESRNLRLTEGISFDVETWKLTYENAVAEEVPTEVLESIENVWRDIERTQKNLSNLSNRLLKLESRIYDQKSIVNKVIEDLITLKTSEVYNLFHLRHKPLWKSVIEKKDQKESKEKVETITGYVSDAIEYVKVSESRLYLVFIVIVVIIFLLNYVKRAYLKYSFNEEDGDLQNAKDIIINHSVSGGILLSLITIKYFFRTAPTILSDSLIFFITIACIPLVRPYMYKRFKRIIVFAAIFFLLDTLKTYFWFSSFHYRIYLLVEALLVITILFIFTFPYLKTRKMKIGRFGALLIRMTPVLYFLSFISIISNLLGYTNLSDLTLKISTQGGVTALIFYALLMVTGGMTIGIIHQYYSKKGEVEPEKKLEVEKKTLVIIRIIAFIYWFIIFLVMIDQLRPVTQYFTDVFTEPYKIGTISFTIGAIITFVLILASSFLITSLVSFIFGGGVSMKFIKMPKGVPAAISLVIRYFIIAFGFVLALSALGIDLSKFNLMAGALGLGIGFGLQGIVSNFISGLILVFERPILVGDTVEVNNLLGTVNRIGVRSSSISTFEGAEVVVPNNNLITNDLINWTLTDNIKRVEILIGTTYGSDPNEILKILVDVTNNYKRALKKPKPYALFSEFGESSLNFKVRFWVPYEIGLEAKSDVSVAIYNRFKEEGVEIPFPQQDIHIKNMPK